MTAVLTAAERRASAKVARMASSQVRAVAYFTAHGDTDKAAAATEWLDAHQRCRTCGRAIWDEVSLARHEGADCFAKGKGIDMDTPEIEVGISPAELARLAALEADGILTVVRDEGILSTSPAANTARFPQCPPAVAIPAPPVVIRSSCTHCGGTATSDGATQPRCVDCGCYNLPPVTVGRRDYPRDDDASDANGLHFRRW